MDSAIDASVKFRYDLTFGLSRTRGFYVPQATSPPTQTVRRNSR